MSFEGNFFAQALGETQEHPNTVEYKKILKERDELKQSIVQNLKRMNFTQSEISEVLSIVEEKYRLVEEAKKPLININENDILNEVEDETKSNIQNISQDMLNELRAKVAQIQARKK